MANPELRARLPESLIFLVRLIAPFKNTGRDWGNAEIMEEALLDWFCRPENLALIKKHKLVETFEARGLTLPDEISKALTDSGTPESNKST